ncbi:MAG TPA: hypothetical protein VGD94_00690 [Vicinamibacterales bacterium]
MRRARKTNGAKETAEPEVIEGIIVAVNGRELAVRVGERIRWHRERGDSLIAQMKKLTEVERSAAEDLAAMLGGRYESPRGVLERRLREHQDRATFLAFIRDHISPDAIYRLTAADLKMIDVLPEP